MTELTVLLVIGLIFVLILAFIFVSARLSYKLAFLADRKKSDNIYKHLDGDEPWRVRMRGMVERLSAVEFSDLYITSRDGLILHAYYKAGREGAPLVIMCHGYRSSPCLDFSGGAFIEMEKGYSVLLIDQRSHGKSEGEYISYGVLERFDVLDWAIYMKENFSPREIILYGVSMGAATVIMASELALPAEVVGIIADCPFSSPEKIINKVSSDMGFPEWLFRLPTRLAARIHAGFNLGAASPERAIRNSALPLLLIHGDADGYVPHWMSRDIYEARPEGTVHITFAGADHARSYVTDTEKYKKAIQDFEEKILRR